MQKSQGFFSALILLLINNSKCNKMIKVIASAVTSAFGIIISCYFYYFMPLGDKVLSLLILSLLLSLSLLTICILILFYTFQKK